MSEDVRWTTGFLISGRVQGVGFRFFAKQLADQIGVVGWVRNLADGRVEALASGSPSQLAALLAGLEEGPVGARVDDIEKIEGSEHPDLTEFKIKF